MVRWVLNSGVTCFLFRFICVTWVVHHTRAFEISIATWLCFVLTFQLSCSLDIEIRRIATFHFLEGFAEVAEALVADLDGGFTHVEPSTC